MLVIKRADTGEMKSKGRLFLGGHRDKGKHNMVHTASTLSHSTVCILLATASILGLDVYTEDVLQAFLQAASLQHRRIFVKSDVLELSKNEFPQLFLPLYSLVESGDYWHKTLSEHCVRESHFEQSAGDLSLPFRRVGDDMLCVSGRYVDDVIRAAPAADRPQLEADLRR